MPHARRIAFALFLLIAASGTLVAAALAADATVPQRARDLSEGGHWKHARQLLEEQLRATPDDPASLSAMAEVRAEFGALDEAEKLARRAVSLAPNDAQAHESLAKVLGQRAQKAGMLKAMGLAGQFRKEAAAAIALDAKRIDAREMLMEFYLKAPGFAGGDKKKARAMAEEIGAIDAARGELAVAECAADAKDTLAIEGCYRRAIAKNPHNIEAHVLLANWLLAPQRLKVEEAEQQARAALAEAPDRSGGYSLLVLAAARRQNWAPVDSVLAASDEHSPDGRSAWYQAGRLLLLDGHDFPRAERCFRHYLEIEPEPNNPTLAHAHWRLAQVLEKEGRKPDAVAELQTALRLKPDLDDAKKDLKRLKG